MTAQELLNELKEIDPNKDCILIINGKYKGSDFNCFSWRGAYDMPASLIYDGLYFTVEEVILNLEEIDGKKVNGYKGGTFTLSKYSYVYLVESENETGDSFSVTSIEELDNCVYMHTENNQY